MQTLVYDAYSHYSSLTPGVIERLRLKHRLRVVQQLEDGVGRNVVRSVIGDGFFSQDELQVTCCLCVTVILFCLDFKFPSDCLSTCFPMPPILLC